MNRPDCDMYVACAEMLVRRPASEAFQAFVDPSVTTKFWLASSSGPLEAGASVHWEFLVPGAKVDVHVREFEADRRLCFDWSDGTYVDLRFAERGPDECTVRVLNGGFRGDEAARMARAIEATQGFTIVLCDMKVLLESGDSPRLSADKAVVVAEAK
jgi:uncharacterized protein YndB with AHSA1/START domain